MTAQVGQVLTVQGTLISGQNVSYVWKFWDGTVRATTVPYVQKVINKGGTLHYDMLAIDDTARVATFSGVVVANAPPVLTSVSLSDNDSPAPYTTSVTSTWLDPENTGPITVMADGQADVISSPGISIIDLLVASNRTVLLSGTDFDGGITQFPIDLRVTSAPLINVVGSADPPVARIGFGTTVMIGAFAEDQNGQAITQFQWFLETAGGWATNQTLTAPGDGPIIDQGGGGFSSFVTISLFGQVAGNKVIRLVASTPTSSAEVSIPITLVANSAPVVTSFGISGSIGAGQASQVSAVATDADGDILTYAWAFNRPFGINRSGNPVSVTLASGSVIEGTVVVSDPLGGSVTAYTPRILITSPTVATGVRGLAFNYAITAMGYAPVVVGASGLPAGLTLSGQAITGTPVSFGIIDILLTASSADGVDVKTLRLTISDFTPPPPAPSNLKVNGSINPTYIATDSLSVTMTLVNDLPNLENPTAILELRTAADDLKLTINLAAGVNTITITPTQINAAFLALPTFILRAYSTRAGVRSDFFTQVTVVRV